MAKKATPTPQEPVKKITPARRGLSGEMKTIRLFYDGVKYKEPVFVGINGMTWLVRRGEDVEVPAEVYEVLMNQEEQDQRTSMLIADLTGQAREILQ